MASSKIVSSGHKISLNRTWKVIPDYTAPTVFKVGTGTTDANITDTDLETPVNINGGQTKPFVSGYPVLDEINFIATVRALLLSTEANGNDLTEFALFNTDGSPLMMSRATHTLIPKNTSTQIIYLEKDQDA